MKKIIVLFISVMVVLNCGIIANAAQVFSSEKAQVISITYPPEYDVFNREKVDTKLLNKYKLTKDALLANMKKYRNYLDGINTKTGGEIIVGSYSDATSVKVGTLSLYSNSLINKMLKQDAIADVKDKAEFTIEKINDVRYFKYVFNDGKTVKYRTVLNKKYVDIYAWRASGKLQDADKKALEAVMKSVKLAKNTENANDSKYKNFAWLNILYGLIIIAVIVSYVLRRRKQENGMPLPEDKKVSELNYIPKIKDEKDES